MPIIIETTNHRITSLLRMNTTGFRKEHGTSGMHQVKFRCRVSGVCTAAHRLVVGKFRWMGIEVREQDYAFSAINCSMYKSDIIYAIYSRTRASCKDIIPLFYGKSAPTIVFRIASVADGIVAPISLSCLIEQVVNIIAIIAVPLKWVKSSLK